MSHIDMKGLAEPKGGFMQVSNKAKKVATWAMIVFFAAYAINGLGLYKIPVIVQIIAAAVAAIALALI